MKRSLAAVLTTALALAACAQFDAAGEQHEVRAKDTRAHEHIVFPPPQVG
jgi:ABC-type glycerol-3-phosphate transport system substrate-binding protein